MLAKTRISVVIPLYNKKRHISRSIKSILNQTYQCSEIVVVNDGSTDGGEKEVEKIDDSRIRLIQQKNKGVSCARNRGIKEARHELIAFLDADDAWKPDFLETIIYLKNKYPEAGIFGTAIELFRSKQEIIQTEFYNIPKTPWDGIIEDYFISAIFRYPLSSSSIAIPKIVFERIGDFDERMSREEDVDLWNRIAINYPIAFSNTFCAVYYMDSDNRAGHKAFENDRGLEVSKLEAYLRQYSVSREKEVSIKEYVAKVRISKASCLLARNKNKEEILRELEKSKSTKLFKGLWWKIYFKAQIKNLLPDKVLRAIQKVRGKQLKCSLDTR